MWSGRPAAGRLVPGLVHRRPTQASFGTGEEGRVRVRVHPGVEMRLDLGGQHLRELGRPHPASVFGGRMVIPSFESS